MIVFDMAGTTVDEDNVVYKTLQSAITDAGYPVKLEVVLEHGAGKEKLDATRDILVAIGENPAQAPAIHADFREQLEQAYAELEVIPFAGTEALFADLRQEGIKVVLNTGYDRATATGLVQQLGWEQGRDYDLLVTADEVSNSRPTPDMILLAMEQLGVASAKEVMKIGDSQVDIAEGQNAGCGITLGVTTGAQTAEQLRAAQPDGVIDTLPELRRYL